MTIRQCRFVSTVFVGLAAALPLASGHTQPPAKNATKGQAQMLGANGKFGTVYTLKSDFNVELLAARYTLEPFNASQPISPKKDEKLLTVDLAVKNVSPKDNDFYTNNTFLSAFDAQGNETKVTLVLLASRAENTSDPQLKPGQGIGQPALHDPLRAVFVLPAKARIVKLVLNDGRKGSAENVLRYYVAGATKEEAGEVGDPKNVIAPLPAAVRDAADPTGSTPMDIGKATMDAAVISGPFSLHLDSFTYPTDIVGDDQRGPGNNERFAVATITATNLCVGERDAGPLVNSDGNVVTDADMNAVKSRYHLAAHSSTNLDSSHKIKQGASYTYRLVFPVAKDATQKTFDLGVDQGRLWEFDVSGVK